MNMSDTLTTETPETRKNEAEAQRLRDENLRLKDGLEGVLTILGNPEGYCEDDRVEVGQAVAEAERALGRRPDAQWRRLDESHELPSGRVARPAAD